MKEGICRVEEIPNLSSPIVLPPRVKFLLLSDIDNRVDYNKRVRGTGMTDSDTKKGNNLLSFPPEK